MIGLKEKFQSLVQKDLEEIERELENNLNPYLDLVRETASHLLFSGGKRFRPLLMVLCARLCGYSGNNDKLFSTAFEYLHAATLLHDDLVDGADLRRGKPVAHSIWGAPTTVLVGDFLLARALSVGAKTGRMQVIEALSEVTEQMSQGEILQLLRKGRLELTEEEYLDVIFRKTAVLIQAACRVGAIIADGKKAEESALSAYGLNIGFAFQMADDLLDYTSETEVLGKATGADLREGKLTLPLIYALKAADGQDRKEMQKIVQNRNFSQAEFQILVELMNAYGGLAYTREKAAAYIDTAKSALDRFEPSETKDILLFVADYALARKT